MVTILVHINCYSYKNVLSMCSRQFQALENLMVSAALESLMVSADSCTNDILKFIHLTLEKFLFKFI